MNYGLVLVLVVCTQPRISSILNACQPIQNSTSTTKVEKEGPDVGRLKVDTDEAAEFTRAIADEENELRQNWKHMAQGTATEDEKTAMKNITGSERASAARLERGIDQMVGRELGIRRAQDDEMSDWAHLAGAKGETDKSHEYFDEAVRRGHETEAEYQQRPKLGQEEQRRRQRAEQSMKKRQRYQPE